MEGQWTFNMPLGNQRLNEFEALVKSAHKPAPVLVLVGQVQTLVRQYTMLCNKIVRMGGVNEQHP